MIKINIIIDKIIIEIIKISLIKGKDNKTQILRGTITKIQTEIHINKIKTKSIMVLKVIKRQQEMQMKKNRAQTMWLINRKQKIKRKNNKKDKNK